MWTFVYCVTFPVQHAELPQKGQHLTKDTAFVSHYLCHPQLVPEGAITQTNCKSSNHLYHLKMCHLPVNCVRFLFGLWSSKALQHMGSPACLRLSLLESQMMHPHAWLDCGTGVNWCHSSEILEQHWFTLTGNAALGLWTKIICHCSSYMTCYDKLWHLLRQVFTCNNFKWYKPATNHLLWQWTKHYCTACTDLIIHQMHDNI